MDDTELRELQDPANWDYANVQRHPVVEKPRAVVSVALARADFERVSEYAARLGVPISRAIRDAVLEKIAAESPAPQVAFTGATTDLVTYVNTPRATNLVWSTQTTNIEEPGATAMESRGALYPSPV